MRLGDVVEIWDKYRIPVKEQDRKPGPYPYCGANGVIDYVDGYTHDGEFVLLAEDGGYFGPFEKSAYIMRGKFWANNHVHILKAIERTLTNEYLMFYLNFINLIPYLTGSTRPKLTQEDMKKIPVTLPPLPEQQKIAEILSTVDKAIEKVDEVIAKTERLKKGLMQELLTKGIGHKEFKDTEIGRIPKDWEVVRVKEIIELLTDFEANGSFSDLKYNVRVYDTPNYAWYVRATDLENKRFPPHEEIKYVDKESYEFLKKTKTFWRRASNGKKR